jgi:type II secretory pathway pseudopilin PulG
MGIAHAMRAISARMSSSASPAACDRLPAISTQAAQAGFTYLGVIFLVALMGMVLASVGTVASFERQREKEKELLFVGNQFRRAIQMYYERTPGPVKQYPESLEALLEDSRFPTTQRYLRKIYPDPITGKAEWGTVEAPGGGVMGVYSLSDVAPKKRAHFREADQDFEGNAAYSDWKFVYISQQIAAPSSRTQPANRHGGDR